jgi:hypothetical protein
VRYKKTRERDITNGFLWFVASFPTYGWRLRRGLVRVCGMHVENESTSAWTNEPYEPVGKKATGEGRESGETIDAGRLNLAGSVHDV